MWKIGVIGLATAISATAGVLSEKPHPRLWLPASSEGWLREKTAGDPLAMELQAAAMKQAERILTRRTCRYEIADGKRLLPESRLALGNIMGSAWAWRMSGDEKFRLRAIAELEAACALKDWHPAHFLDTAEMAAAVATGYDWLYSTLTPPQREMCERAIIEKALKPAKSVYDKAAGWAKPRNNWSQVCGSGITLAAIAIAGHDDGLSEDLFARGMKLVQSCSAFYQPDGMYPEGPGYWHYGTNYHVMLLAACHAMGLPADDNPILRKGGEGVMWTTGPTRMPFNFADGHAELSTPSPAQCWLAAEFQDPIQASYVRGLFARALRDDNSRFSDDRWLPLSVLWLPPVPKAAVPDPRKCAVFHGEQAVAVFRTSWDADAAWLAIKGGTPASNHGHMDVGSFCYDAHGTRWIHDLGGDNYNLPAYFGDKRFTYYRLQNRSHNTLEIAGKLQEPHSQPCPLTASVLTGNPLSAAFDLSGAYSNSAKKVLRSARFDANTGTARIEDEITAPAGDVVWRAFTDAEAEVKGDQVILRKNGSQITLRRVSSSGTWTIADAKPPTPEEYQNKGFHAVVLTVPQAARVSLAVEIRP